jgi:ribonuclease VapC
LIVDTSALVAVARAERGWEPIWNALHSELGFIPAPALVELSRVTSDKDNLPHAGVTQLLETLASCKIVVESFTARDAQAAITANTLYGSGNGKGGKLNMLDLMVYAMAKARSLPILCTGDDFPTTDALIHPASRIG